MPDLPVTSAAGQEPAAQAPAWTSGCAPRAQQRGGGFIGELLAGDSGDEVPAADEPAGLEPTQRPQNLPPGNSQALLEVDITEHHAPTRQELPRDCLRELVGIVDRGRGGQQRPAALDARSPCAAPPPR